MITGCHATAINFSFFRVLEPFLGGVRDGEVKSLCSDLINLLGLEGAGVSEQLSVRELAYIADNSELAYKSTSANFHSRNAFLLPQKTNFFCTIQAGAFHPYH